MEVVRRIIKFLKNETIETYLKFEETSEETVLGLQKKNIKKCHDQISNKLLICVKNENSKTFDFHN